MESPEALYKKLSLLGEICFDLITFCQDERTCVMYLSEFFYPSCGVFGSLEKIEKKIIVTIIKNIVRVPRCPCFDATTTSLKSRRHELRHPTPLSEQKTENKIQLTVDDSRGTLLYSVFGGI